jgi:hypothetical protein
MNVFEDKSASNGALETKDFPLLIKGIGDGACLYFLDVNFLLRLFAHHNKGILPFFSLSLTL